MKYRFRTLLLLIAVIALILAVVTPYYQRYRAMRILHEHGGAIYFAGNPGHYRDEPTWLNVFSRVRLLSQGSQCSDPILQNALRQLTEVQRISFHASTISKEAATLVGKLTELDEFGTGLDVDIDAEDLEFICRSPSLRTIALLFPLQQRHFEVLGRNKSLTTIHVHFTFVTDENLRQLIERPRLNTLSFSFSNGMVPREAIEALLQRHPKVILSCFSSDPEGEQWWDELREKFPECRIIR